MPSMDLRLVVRSWSAMTESAESPLLRSHYTRLPNSPTTPPADRKRRLRRLRRRTPRRLRAHVGFSRSPALARSRPPRPHATCSAYVLRITHHALRLTLAPFNSFNPFNDLTPP
jgi:hypothetical protein